MRETLSDTFILELRVGDYWALRFSNDWWLTAVKIEVSTERKLRDLINSSFPRLLEGCDAKENVPVLTCLGALMRESVKRCDIDEDGSLRIKFERGDELRMLADVDIVDWAWCVSKDPRCPYGVPSLVYCLGVGQVELGSLFSP